MKPPKYPTPPANCGNVFDWILRTAEQMRRRQSYVAEIERSRRSAESRATLRARAAVVDAELEKTERYWRTED